MYHGIKARTSSKFTFHVMWNMSEDVRHRWEITSTAWAREKKARLGKLIVFSSGFIWKQKPLPPKLLGDTLTSKNRQFLSRQQIFPLLGRLSGEIYDGVNKSRSVVVRRRPWNSFGKQFGSLGSENQFKRWLIAPEITFQSRWWKQLDKNVTLLTDSPHVAPNLPHRSRTFRRHDHGKTRNSTWEVVINTILIHYWYHRYSKWLKNWGRRGSRLIL